MTLTWLVACAPVGDGVSEAPSADPAPWPSFAVPSARDLPSVSPTGDTAVADGVDVGLFGTCTTVPDDAAEMAETRLVGTYHPSGDTPTFASQVFTDLDSYAQFLADLGIVGNFVDFRVEHAAVFGYGGDASCGFSLDGWSAVDLDGTPAVVVRVDDRSWGCDLACSGSPSEVWVFAFPKAAMPATCLRVGGGCGPLP